MSEFMEKKGFLYNNLFLIFFLALTSMFLEYRFTDTNGKYSLLILLSGIFFFSAVKEKNLMLKTSAAGMQKAAEEEGAFGADFYGGIYPNPYDRQPEQKEKNDDGMIWEVIGKDYDFIAVIDGKTERLEIRRQKEQSGLFYEECGRHGMKFEKVSESMIRKGVDEKEAAAVKKALSLNMIRSELEHKEEYILYFHTPDRKMKRQRYLYLNRRCGSILLTQTDITDALAGEKEENEELRKALYLARETAQARTDFFTDASREMCASAEEMSSVTELALKTRAARQKQEYLQKIREMEEKLIRLLEHNLEISRFESGFSEMHLECLEGCSLIREITDMVKSAAAEKNIRFLSESDCVPGKFICADKIHLKELCLNLLSNAVKFTPKGGTVSFSIRQMKTDALGHNVKIMVRDSGIGIGSNFRSKMFEPFSKEYAVPGQETAGAGLGLSLAGKIAELMKGTIRIESSEGRGTTCQVYLGLRTQNGPAMPGEEKNSYHELQQRRVLLVENNILRVEIMKKMLDRKGMLVTWAENGKTGLSLFEKSPAGYYDIILTGIHMPVMGGYELSAKIRASEHSDSAGIPIVAVSGTGQEDLQLYRDAGITGHMNRPLEADSLYLLILEQIAERKHAAHTADIKIVRKKGETEHENQKSRKKGHARYHETAGAGSYHTS